MSGSILLINVDVIYLQSLKVCVAGLLVAAAAGFSGCASHGTVAAPKIADEITVTPALKSFLSNNPRPSVVLRVPSSTGSVLQSENINGNLSYASSIYNIIEQELTKAGFTVRDRQMLSALLGKTDQIGISYEELGRRLQADIIIELNGIDTKDFWQSEYTDDKGATRTYTNENKFDTPYRILSGKLVITNQGAVGGFFTFKHGSAGGEILAKTKIFPLAASSEKKARFKFKENPWKKYALEHPEESKDKVTDANDSWWLWRTTLAFPQPGNTDSAKYFAQKLIALLSNPNAAAASGN